MVMNVDAIKKDLVIKLLEALLRSKFLKKSLMPALEKQIHRTITQNYSRHPQNIRLRKYQTIVAILNTAADNFQNGYISRKFMDLAFNFVKLGLEDGESIGCVGSYREKYAEEPPGFLVLSPTKKCNLACKDCYATSNTGEDTALRYETVEKITREAYNLFGNRFMTISGGEPFFYEDNGKTLFDIWKKFNDMVFLVYTNGTLITEEVARRLGELGNVTPAISVEGFEKETDARRGRGTFKKILKAIGNLKKAGVPVGISVTVTKNNAGIFMKDDFYRFFFEKQNISHMWMFHLMPIGRAQNIMDMMPTAEQRFRLFRKWEELLAKNKWFIADFWNSGAVVDGCIAYARHYFYINWDGNVMPCVFVPYYVDNIHDTYKKGGTLIDAVSSDFFKRGRSWQKNYGLSTPENPGNWLMPCSIKDHYKDFRVEILPQNAKPENESARSALYSKRYFDFLDSFDKKLRELTEPVWKEEYLKDNRDPKDGPGRRLK